MLRLVLDEVAASVGPDLGSFLSQFTLQRCASRFGFQDRVRVGKVSNGWRIVESCFGLENGGWTAPMMSVDWFWV